MMKKALLAMLAAGVFSTAVQAQPSDHKQMMMSMSGMGHGSAHAHGNDPHAANPHMGSVAMESAVLLGEQDPKKMIFELIPIGRQYISYQADAGAVAQLKAVTTPTTLTLIFDSQDAASQSQVAALIKTLNGAGNSNLTARYIGVDAQGQAGTMTLDVTFAKAPTLVVTQGEKEIGRIEGVNKTSVEAGLAALLK